jgi:hypothetical protein
MYSQFRPRVLVVDPGYIWRIFESLKLLLYMLWKKILMSCRLGSKHNIPHLKYTRAKSTGYFVRLKL